MLVKFTTVMAGSRPQQLSPPHAKSVNVNQQGELHNLEQGNHVDNQREGSSQMIHVGRSGYQRRSHLVQEHADEKDLQQEIEDLKKKLRRAQRKQTPSSFDVSSNDEGIILSSRYQVTIRWSELYSESRCIKSWKRLRTSPSSNGPIR